MRLSKVKINGFKNLIDFEIDLNENQIHTILLGQNASGKSNFLEALVIIFRDLDLNAQPIFQFDIEYKCKNNYVRVIGNPDLKSGYEFYVKGVLKPITKAAFYRDKDEFLPKYVFSYYSGVSNRLVEHFDIHQKRFYDDLLAGKDEPLRPLFYARLIHSHFVLMAFYSFGKKHIEEFLEEYFDIVGLESILFVLKKPIWVKGKKDALDFWGARGVVREFLNDLWESSMAPISNEDTIREDFRRSHKQECLYLYISNQEKLETLARKYGTNTNFFKMLESTYISDLIHEVKVKVKKRNVNGHVTFKELSEGEQQLLTVLGLLRFTKAQESLMLLDEPDTHLNPLWKWEYMKLIDKIVESDASSQIIMTTHDPLVIGGLTKDQIRIFHTEKDTFNITATEPEFDPRGLGVAGILTSELFGLPSTLDKETLSIISKRNELITKSELSKLNNREKIELNNIFNYLNNLGINTTDRDPLYQLFISALSKKDEFDNTKLTEEDLKKQNDIALDTLNELLKENEK